MKEKTCVGRGFSLVEILIASSLLIMIVVGVVGALQLFTSVSASDRDKTQAAILTQEAAEALQIMRDTSWDSAIAPLAASTTYQLYWAGASYTATTSDVVLHDRFIRTFVLSDVFRDANDDIAGSGTEDAGTRKVLIEVSLAEDGDSIARSEFLLHNTYEN